MRSYLSLISISTKVRKKQSRMTVLCIVIAVFLVTIVFSMTDMLMRAELSHQVDKNGSWHLMFEDISDLTASDIASRLDVAAAGWSSAFNVNAEQDYEIGDVKAALYGTDAAYIEQLMEGLKEGKFLSTDHEVMLSTNARDYLNLKIGDTVVLHTPAGASEYTVSGFGGDDEAYYEGQFYLVGVYMTREAFQFVMEENGVNQISSSFYVQFHSASKADRARTEIKEQYQLSDGQIGENTAVMGLSGASSNESMMGIYGIAVVLFVLVLMAGVLMISGSMNSNISQRMNFFGMLSALLGVISLIMFIPVLYKYIQTGMVPNFPTLIVSGFVALAAMVSFFSGLILSEIVEKERREYEFRLQMIEMNKEKVIK